MNLKYEKSFIFDKKKMLIILWWWEHLHNCLMMSWRLWFPIFIKPILIWNSTEKSCLVITTMFFSCVAYRFYFTNTCKSHFLLSAHEGHIKDNWVILSNQKKTWNGKKINGKRCGFSFKTFFFFHCLSEWKFSLTLM
jgi:hypothetical protein